jgi:hypothetical protein
MALYVDTADKCLHRTTNITPGNQAVSTFFRGYVVGVGLPNFRTMQYIGDDPVASYDAFMWWGRDNVVTDEIQADLFDNFPGSGGSNLGPPLAGGARTFCYTRDPADNSHRFYVDGVLAVGPVVFDMTAATLTHMMVGSDTYDLVEGLNYIDNFMEWRGVTLTPAEVAAQSASPTAPAVRLDALTTFTPLLDDLVDTIGSDDWEVVGFELGVVAEPTFVAFPDPPPGSEYGAGTPTIITDTYSDHDMQCPAEWENGFKAAFVKRFGEGTRTGSDPWTGDWQGSTFNLTLIDDGRFRRELRSTTDRFWFQDSWVIRMTTRANRAVLGLPYTVFVGPVIDVDTSDPTLLGVTLGDIVSQQILTDEHQVPYRKIGDGFLSLLTEIPETLDRETPEPIAYGIHLRTVADVPSPQGFEVILRTLLGKRLIGSDQYWVWLVCGHACADVLDLQTIDADGVHTSVLADEGTKWLIPHYANYLAQFGNPYEDLRSDTFGVDRRYTLVYGKVGETEPDAVAAGELTLAIHIEGIEPIGDGSGDVITDRIQQYKHFLINYVANHGANSYQSGAWLTNPSWDVFGVSKPIIEEISFDDCTAIAESRIMGEGSPQDAGYIGAALIGAKPGDRASVKRWIADWNRSCAVQFGINHFGQIRVWMLHPTAAIKAAAPLYTDNYEILEGSFRPSFQLPQMVNRVPFKTDYHHETGVWRTVDMAQAPDAIKNYGRVISSEDREYPFAPGITMANHMAVLETRVRQHPPRYVVLEATVGPDYNNKSLGYLDLGDYFRYVHFGAIAEQNEIRLAQAVRHQVQAGRRVVQVEGFDCEELIGFDEPDVLVTPPTEASPSEFNDTCATAMEITQEPFTPFTITIDTTEHARDTSVEGSPVLLPAPGEAYHAAWFAFTPWANGTLFLTTVWSLYDTVMVVFTGSCAGSPALDPIQSNDNDGALSTSILEFPVTGGVELRILVYGYGPNDGGSLTFSLYFTEPE